MWQQSHLQASCSELLAKQNFFVYNSQASISHWGCIQNKKANPSNTNCPDSEQVSGTRAALGQDWRLVYVDQIGTCLEESGPWGQGTPWGSWLCTGKEQVAMCKGTGARQMQRPSPCAQNERLTENITFPQLCWVW